MRVTPMSHPIVKKLSRVSSICYWCLGKYIGNHHISRYYFILKWNRKLRLWRQPFQIKNIQRSINPKPRTEFENESLSKIPLFTDKGKNEQFQSLTSLSISNPLSNFSSLFIYQVQYVVKFVDKYAQKKFLFPWDEITAILLRKWHLNLNLFYVVLNVTLLKYITNVEFELHVWSQFH